MDIPKFSALKPSDKRRINEFQAYLNGGAPRPNFNPPPPPNPFAGSDAPSLDTRPPGAGLRLDQQG